MRIDVFTIFPDLITNFVQSSLIGKAVQTGVLDIRTHNPRDVAPGVHRATDDSPFGGGAGMVMSPGPIFSAVEAADPPRPLFLLSPAGRRFDQPLATELSQSGGFSLLCGRYEGVDDRVRTHLCDGEISIGDYVLNGGETAAAVVIEAVGRLVPGVMGNAESWVHESFAADLLEHPQFTRPADFRGIAVPDVLLSGDHARIARWRLAKSIERTQRSRPDLIERRGGLSAQEKAVLDEFSDQQGT